MRSFCLDVSFYSSAPVVVVVCGPPNECAEKIKALRALGFSRVGLNLSPAQDLDLLVSSLSPAAIAAST
jgi:hypothetical protein